ncbi:MAG: hypothetical protein U5J78_03045 [Parasphingorhabdus sp.]|nr:hypothetical protein [Parasphingorhabdus sp.]
MLAIAQEEYDNNCEQSTFDHGRNRAFCARAYIPRSAERRDLTPGFSAEIRSIFAMAWNIRAGNIEADAGRGGRCSKALLSLLLRTFGDLFI